MKIQLIEISKLKQHPNNVRKEYRDIDELAESIKRQGIMQNLTVVPDPDQEGTYLVVIGNRRLAAAKQAGFIDMPCIVTNMTEQDQTSTMLLENMQRSDLTVYEQATGFQMCLDLGMTEDSIVEKTGFSKTTVRHRLNLAKLDQKLLKNKDADDGFQMTLKNLYDLEKIDDVKIRNRILRDCTDSKQISNKVNQEIRELDKKKKIKVISSMLKKMGIEKAPDSVKNDCWSGKWDTVKEFDFDKDVPKQIRIKETEGVVWFESYSGIKCVKKKSKEKKVLTEAEKIQKQNDRDKKYIKSVIKELRKDMKEFILSFISEKNYDSTYLGTTVLEEEWNIIMDHGSWFTRNSIEQFLNTTGIENWNLSAEQREEIKSRFNNLSFPHCLLIAMFVSTDSTDTCMNYYNKYDEEKGEVYISMGDVLRQFGWTPAIEEMTKVIHGTHELYKKEDEE